METDYKWENSALFYPREFFNFDEIVFRNGKQGLILFTWISFCPSLEMVAIKLFLSFDHFGMAFQME